MSKKIKWPDLSEYGMRLRLAVTPNSNFLLMEQVPAEHVDAVLRLGFTQHLDSGNWIKVGGSQLNSKEFQREFPKLKTISYENDEYVLNIKNRPPKKAPNKGSAPDASNTDHLSATFLGLNKYKEKVFELNGKRFRANDRGRRIAEGSLARPSPGSFLRAVDKSSMKVCAEGFIETVLQAQDTDAHISIRDFIATIGLAPSESEEFISAVKEVSTRLISGTGLKNLHERYSVALKVSRFLNNEGVDGDVSYDQVVMARRLLGMDRYLLGHSIYFSGSNSELFDQIKPKTVRMAGHRDDADFIVSIAQSADGAIEDMRHRKAGAMSISFIPVGNSDPLVLLGEIGAIGSIETAAIVDLGFGTRTMVVTSIPGEPSTIPEIVEIGNEADFWSWASVTVSQRTHAIENVRSGLAAEENLVAANLAQNTHQVPYKSASRAGKPLTMIPKELDEATRVSLSRLISNYGDIDRKVSIECGIPLDDLPHRLSPEQIDGVALAIQAEEKGRGFLFADNTGVGKGRALMSLAKRAVLQGKKVLVLTEKAINMSDLMRDLKHIDALNDVKPVVMNQDVLLIDESSGEPFDTVDRSVLEQAISEKVWPDGVPVVFSTYSQFNQNPLDSPRSAWLREVVDQDTLVIADEIHVASSGSSNTSENISYALEASSSPVFSSATFAADAKSISFYERLFPYGISGLEVSAMMRKGGEPFMEIVAAMLVADGVMIRREKDMSNLEITQHLDEERLERNRSHMDALASVISEMAFLSGEMDRILIDENRRDGSVLKEIELKRMGFGSPLYMMTRLFSASLLAEYAAERAINALNSGEKPIVLVENTIQGVLNDAVINGGDVPDFKDVMRRILGQLTKASYTNENGEANHLDIADGREDVRAALLKINRMIDELPDLPASAIDVVKERIKEAGFSCGEITGRSLEVVDGKVVPRKERNVTKIKNAFNAGEIQALVINTVGSTGIDLHSSRRFKDQSRRVMIELQGPAYVKKQIQAYGRISRYDEVVPSRIEILSSGLPVEVRLAAMRNQKLRRLSANVTSNRDSVFLTKNIPDLINVVGDEIVRKYAEMRPDLVKKLCLSYADDDGRVTLMDEDDSIEENKQDNERSANEFLARLAMLPTAYQERVLGELMAEYELHIAELEARGENPLRPKELDGIVKIRDSKIFEGKDNSDHFTLFDAPLHIREVEIERVVSSIKAEDLIEAVEFGGENYGKAETAADNITSSKHLYLESYVPKNFRSVQEALDSGNARMVQMSQDLDVTASALRALVPGCEINIRYGLDNERVKAIVTEVKSPETGFQHLRSQYRVSLAIPGETKIITVRLSTLLKEMGLSVVNRHGFVKFNVSDGLSGKDYERILDKFDNASAQKITTGRILSTNIFRAVRMATQYNIGKLVSYVDSDGNRHRGVMVKKNFENFLEMLPVRLDGFDEIMDVVLNKRIEVSSSDDPKLMSLKISPTTDNNWEIVAPLPRKTKSGLRWPSEDYKALFESGVDKAPNAVVQVHGSVELARALETIIESGTNTFYADGKMRRYFNDENDVQPSNVGIAI